MYCQLIQPIFSVHRTQSCNWAEFLTDRLSALLRSCGVVWIRCKIVLSAAKFHCVYVHPFGPCSFAEQSNCNGREVFYNESGVCLHHKHFFFFYFIVTKVCVTWCKTSKRPAAYRWVYESIHRCVVTVRFSPVHNIVMDLGRVVRIPCLELKPIHVVSAFQRQQIWFPICETVKTKIEN